MHLLEPRQSLTIKLDKEISKPLSDTGVICLFLRQGCCCCSLGFVGFPQSNHSGSYTQIEVNETGVPKTETIEPVGNESMEPVSLFSNCVHSNPNKESYP